MAGNHSISTTRDKEVFTLPQTWQDQIVSEFERLEASPFPEQGALDKSTEAWRSRCLPKFSALLNVLASTATHPSTTARIAELLLRKLKLALRPSSSLAINEAHFIVSEGFSAYVRMSKSVGGVDKSLLPLLRAATPRFGRLLGFLEALLSYESELDSSNATDANGVVRSSTPESEEEPFITSLVANLSSPSHELRLASLRLLKNLGAVQDDYECLSTMIQAEEMPLTPQNVRAIAVLLRRLALNFSHMPQSWLQRAVPTFLFGMMTVKMTPVWKDATDALKQVAEVTAGENVVCDLAFEWLEVDSYRFWSGEDAHGSSTAKLDITEFSCPEHIKLTKAASELRHMVEESVDIMREQFDQCQNLEDRLPANARSQALKILNVVPALAEKRSRRLVPFFLSWNRTVPESEVSEDDEEEHAGQVSWSLYDRKAILGVFSQFSNPRVLYQHERVYAALLGCLANGDAEVQKLALKAILAWKQEGVKPYQENLEYLLDDARFKDELTVLLQGGTVIQPEHRADLMPVLLRLLYGRMIAKKGTPGGRHGPQTTRLSVLRNLDLDATGRFIQIALGELRNVRVVNESGLIEASFKGTLLPLRNQLGFLNMAETIIKELGSDVASYTEDLGNAILYCVISACRQLFGSSRDATDDDKQSQRSLVRDVRSSGLKCLGLLFQNSQSFDWTAYKDAMVHEIISPQIERLPVETAQGISGTLRLLSTWATLPKTAPFLASDGRILPAVVSCLAVPKAKDEVKIFALSIVDSLVQVALAPATESEFNDLVKEEILVPNIDGILAQVSSTLTSEDKPSYPLLSACVETIVRLAVIIEDSDKIVPLVWILLSFLGPASRAETQGPKGLRIDPRTKGRILLILQSLILRDEVQADADLVQRLHDTIASQFGFFLDRQNREVLSQLFLAYASRNEESQEVAELCADLNSYLKDRIDEPDYDRRVKAFAAISSDRQPPFTAKAWTPLLYNLAFFMQKDEEFSILNSNSADGICRFISVTAALPPGDEKSLCLKLLGDIVMKGIEASSRDPSESVRREYLRVFGFLATNLPDWAPVADLSALRGATGEVDDEPTFFFNILSPALSKQLEAIQMLVEANAKSEISSRNLSQYFIPLTEHFIFDRLDGSDDRGLGAAATNAIADLTLSLEWRQFRALLRRYISYTSTKPELQKQVIRLLGKVVDSLETSHVKRTAEDAETNGTSASRRLSKTLPTFDVLNTEIVDFFLPPLLDYLHEKDESTVSARVPVGLIIVKLLKLLPEETKTAKLPGVLTDICHILRSKAWESREMARDTLSKISTVLGPGYFGFILKELRGALTRGYQLHVLSYTMHSILLAVIPEFGQGEIDYCLGDIVAIIMDDIFGVVGLEKDAEEYVSKMKEVKSSKSQDSMELVAKTASVSRLIELVRPLQLLLMEKLDLRTVRKVDELLTRIATGLSHNPAAESQDTLIFCYEVIRESYQKEEPDSFQKLDPKLRKYLIQSGAKKSGERGSTTKYTHKLARFGLDILRTVFKRYDSLRTSNYVVGLIQLLGDAVTGAEEELKIAAFKLISVLDRVLTETDEGISLLKIASKEASRSIASSPRTTTDIAQAALKLKSDVLRFAPSVPVRETDVDMLLGKVKDDLTEPLYRSVTFNFLRSVLGRKIETAVVYDTLDYVGTVMITNDDQETRNLARGAFFQFLQTYPQKRNRWTKQINFIIANLKYEREGGRISIMEVLHQLLTKSADEYVQELAATCFIPLVFVLANDESEKCRLLAGALVRQIFDKADEERTKKFLALLRTWLGKDDNPSVARLGLQAFGFYFQAKEPSTKDKKDFALLVKKVGEIVETARESAESIDPELVNAALALYAILVRKFPGKLLAPESKEFWSDVQDLLSYPKAAVRLSCLALVGLYLEDFASNSNGQVKTLQMKGSHGISLDKDDISQLMQRHIAILRAEGLDEKVVDEVVKIVAFLSMHLDASSEEGDSHDDDVAGGEERSDRDDEDDGEHTNLHQVLRTLSKIIRKETPPLASELLPKTAAMQILQVLCGRLPVSSLTPSLKTILRPLHNLTDPSIAVPFSMDSGFKTRYEDLKAKAQDVLDLLQKRLGRSEFSTQMLAVREAIKEKRQSRSGKRKIEAVVQPERAGREKRKKFEKKKERRKLKSQQYRDMRRAY